MAGSGGGDIDPCKRANWTVTASVLCTAPLCALLPASQKDPRYAIDGDLETRYTTGIPQGSKGPETVTLTFPSSVALDGLTLVTKGGDGPMSGRLEYATDGTTFKAFTPALVGPGSDNVIAPFPSRTVLRALRLTQLGVKAANWWSIHELNVTGCAAAP